MRFTKDFLETVRADLKAGNIVFLAGEPGIGKSSWTRDLARLMRTECFTVRCNQLADKADLTGCRLVPYTRDDGSQSYMQVFYPHAEIMRCVDYAEAHPDETPLLFLDEINRTNSDVTSELLSIPTDRAIGDVRLPDNIIVMCAGNDRGNVVSLDDASLSRFVIYKMQPDLATYLALDDKLNPYIRTTLEKHPADLVGKKLAVIAPSGANGQQQDDAAMIDAMFDFDDNMDQMTCPRTISALSRWLNQQTDAQLQAMQNDIDTIDGEDISLLREHIEAHVGATAFAAHLLEEIAHSLASPTSGGAAGVVILKPDAYDNLAAQTDITGLDMAIEALPDKARSACLLYALQDAQASAPLIQHLATYTPRFEDQDSSDLIRAAMDGMLNKHAIRVFLDTNQPIAMGYAGVLQTMAE